MDSPINISIVMATYNRADIIGRTLQRLSRQTIRPELMELIVVNDGSQDETAKIVSEFAATAPFRTNYLEHTNRGPGFTQNEGIKAARNDIVMLMADDIFLAPGCVEAHLKFHQQHPGPGFAALGNTTQSPELNLSAFLRRSDAFFLGRFSNGERLPYYRFWAFNISVKRRFMTRYGMYREHYGRAGAAAHEDTELGYRLDQHGLRLHFVDAARGYHYHPWTLEQARKRHYMRGLNYGEFREYVPDPEISVAFRLLTRETLGDYLRVLNGENSLPGRQKSKTWQFFRYAVSTLFFNELTVRTAWPALFCLAERIPLVERIMTSSMYAHYLHFYFLRGVRDAGNFFEASKQGGAHECS